MPVSNSFRCLCKFANRAVMRHKDNYIAPEGILSGLYNLFSFNSLKFLFHFAFLFKPFAIKVDEVFLF